MKKRRNYKEIPLTTGNNPQAGERGGGGKDRFFSRTDRVDDEGEKEELLGKYLDILNPDTAL